MTLDGVGASGKRARRQQVAAERAAAERSRQGQAQRRRILRIAATVSAAVLLLVLTGVGLSRTGGHGPAARVAFDPATRTLDFMLPAFAGGTIDSASLRGRPAVINFYASWCNVCRSEMPAFQRVHERAGSALGFVGVNPQSNDSDATQARMVHDTGVRYTTARDRDDTLLRTFNTTGALPTTLFLDAQGKVVQVHDGGYDEQSLRAAVQQYLGVRV